MLSLIYYINEKRTQLIFFCKWNTTSIYFVIYFYWMKDNLKFYCEWKTPEKFTTNSLETSWGWPELGTDQPQLVSREFVVLNRDNLGCANCQTQRVKSKPHVPFNFNTKAVKALIIWKGIQLLLGSSNSYLTPLNIVTRKGEFVWCGWWWTFG